MRASDHMSKVASLPCVICRFKLGMTNYGVEVHHPTVPANDWVVVPLCVEHHRGSTGVHGLHRKGFERFWKVTDFDLLGWTNELMAKEAM
jgi:hypothetical protein